MAPPSSGRDDPHRDGDKNDRDVDPLGTEDVLEAVLGLDEDDEVVRSIAEVRLRTRCDVEGEVASVGRATGSTVALDVVLSDGTGHLLCHFFGRDAISGVTVGSRLRVEGRLVTYRSRRCLLNPAYELVGAASSDADSS
ncbi:MAG TPA: hypothetical protein VGZ33_03570 [Acidimicrobiales bacterium]|jgi:hypothetical protein|nr:hypothetical protein [Acidimicrobiales bacterium]